MKIEIEPLDNGDNGYLISVVSQPLQDEVAHKPRVRAAETRQKCLGIIKRELEMLARTPPDEKMPPV